MTNTVTVVHVISLSFFLGLVNAFDIPTRHSFVVEIVEDKADLSNGIALNSSLFNAARLIGPALAGVLIALFGEGVCFFLNALSFVPITFVLVWLKISEREKQKTSLDIGREFGEGLRYAFGFVPIRSILLLLSVVSLLGAAFQTLLPVFAREIFAGGPETLGLIVSLSGVGAFLGAVHLAARKTIIGLGRMIGVSAAGFGAALMIFGVMTDIHFALAAAFLLGLTMILSFGASNMVLQTLVDDDKRGRVMSLYGMALIGMAPIGSLLSGFLAGKIGPEGTFVWGGLGCIIAAFVYWRDLPRFRKHVRPVYAQKGIFPEA